MSTGYTTIVEIYIDIATKKTTYVNYKYGITKNLGYHGEGDTEIENKNSNAQQIYLEEREKSDVYSDAEYATVDFYHWGVVVDFYDEEETRQTRGQNSPLENAVEWKNYDKNGIKKFIYYNCIRHLLVNGLHTPFTTLLITNVPTIWSGCCTS